MRAFRVLTIPMLLAFGAGCAPQAPLPLPPAGVTAVHVAPPQNATGREILLYADPGPAGVCGAPPATVPERLDLELRRALVVRGFATDAPDADVLSVRITRWDPAVLVGDHVTVSVDARLTAPDGSVRWQTARDDWTIVSPFRGSDVLLGSYAEAAETVARTLLADWCAPRS